MPEIKETDDERKARQRREVAEYELANDRVPGTASMRGKHPEGGQDWEGRARMDEARQHAGVELDDLDGEALARTARSVA